MGERSLLILVGVAFLLLVALAYRSVLFQGPEGAGGSDSAGASDSPDSRQVLTFGSDPWPPYAGDAASKTPGYIVEVLEAIYEPHGYRVEFVNKPWSRCITETRDGSMTGLAGADREEVPDFAFPGASVGRTRPTFFGRKGLTWRYTGVESLAGVRLGVIQDYTYSEEVDHYIRTHAGSAPGGAPGGDLETDRLLVVKGNDALKRLLQALEAGRIDVLVENHPVVLATLRKLNKPVGDFVDAGVGRKPVTLYVPFSPAHPDRDRLCALFDKGIVQLRKSGALQSILQRYDIEDWNR